MTRSAGLDLELLPEDVGVEGHAGLPAAQPAPHERRSTARSFALAVAPAAREAPPRRWSSRAMKKDRAGGKVFIDWSQNAGFKTTICAYSLRARPASDRVDPGDLGRGRGGRRRRAAVVRGRRRARSGSPTRATSSPPSPPCSRTSRPPPDRRAGATRNRRWCRFGSASATPVGGWGRSSWAGWADFATGVGGRLGSRQRRRLGGWGRARREPRLPVALGGG